MDRIERRILEGILIFIGLVFLVVACSGTENILNAWKALVCVAIIGMGLGTILFIGLLAHIACKAAKSEREANRPITNLSPDAPAIERI